MRVWRRFVWGLRGAAKMEIGGGRESGREGLQALFGGGQVGRYVSVGIGRGVLVGVYLEGRTDRVEETFVGKAVGGTGRE
jgi:hypothetical protein